MKGRLDLAVTDLGPTQLKNIAEPIRVYSLEVGQPAQAKPATTVAAAKSESAATSPKPRAFLRWPALAAALARRDSRGGRPLLGVRATRRVS